MEYKNEIASHFTRYASFETIQEEPRNLSLTNNAPIANPINVKAKQEPEKEIVRFPEGHTFYVAKNEGD